MMAAHNTKDQINVEKKEQRKEIVKFIKGVRSYVGLFVQKPE